jgi:serine phosphatase RsbU (regulator of sigma subunit)
MGLFVNDPYISLSGVKSVLCMPVTDKGKMVGILYLENNLTTGAFTADRLKLLQIVSAQAAISIENSRLIAHREKMTKLQTEMKIAANIQAVLLPERPSIEGFEITAYLKPTEEVGGDYYDVIDTGNNNWVIIGDVSGHGVPAGLIMMMVLTVIQALVRKFPDIKPSDLLSIVNEALKYNVEKIKELKYMTITAFSFQKDGHAVYSGRHQDFLVYRAASSSVDIIPSKGTWLMPWDMGRRNIDSELHLNQGDTMLLYTDGISEAMNTEKLMFSEEKLAAILKQYGTHKTDEIKDKILEELQGYTIRDDMTMVILKKK